MYKAIALKYRPKDFSEVIGQDHIVVTLKNALASKRVSHAYLFCGSRGTGKTTLARVLAKALNCDNPIDNLPCSKCTSCLEIANSCSIDVLEIDGASNRGIDDIRNINENVIYASSQGKYKIYIVDEVHMLTKEAFNALLKTLEEPPSHVKFFFATTEPNKLPPTISSRCQRFDLKRIKIEDIENHLKWIIKDLDFKAEDTALNLIANLAEGSLRDAESILDQVLCYLEDGIITESNIQKIRGLTPKKLLLDLDEAIHSENISYAFSLAAEIFSSGVELYSFVEDLLEHFKNHLIKTLTQEKTSYAKDHLLQIMEILTTWLHENSKTYFKKIHLESLLLQVIQSKTKPSINSLVKDLLELKKNINLNFGILPSESGEICDEFGQLSSKRIVEGAILEEKDEQIRAKVNDSERIKTKVQVITQSAPIEIKKGTPIQPKSKNSPEIALKDIQDEPKILSQPESTQLKLNTLSDIDNSKTHVKLESPDITLNNEHYKTDSPSKKSRYDTLLQFAACELEGTIEVKNG